MFNGSKLTRWTVYKVVHEQALNIHNKYTEMYFTLPWSSGVHNAMFLTTVEAHRTKKTFVQRGVDNTPSSGPAEPAHGDGPRPALTGQGEGFGYVSVPVLTLATVASDSKIAHV
jgi:hypothetical protein